MLKSLQTTKGLIIAAIAVFVIIILISYNWDTIKGWFSSSTLRKTVCPSGTYPWRNGQGKIQCSPN